MLSVSKLRCCDVIILGDVTNCYREMDEFNFDLPLRVISAQVVAPLIQRSLFQF